MAAGAAFAPAAAVTPAHPVWAGGNRLPGAWPALPADTASSGSSEPRLTHTLCDQRRTSLCN